MICLLFPLLGCTKRGSQEFLRIFCVISALLWVLYSFYSNLSHDWRVSIQYIRALDCRSPFPETFIISKINSFRKNHPKPSKDLCKTPEHGQDFWRITLFLWTFCQLIPNRLGLQEFLITNIVKNPTFSVLKFQGKSRSYFCIKLL